MYRRVDRGLSLYGRCLRRALTAVLVLTAFLAVLLYPGTRASAAVSGECVRAGAQTGKDQSIAFPAALARPHFMDELHDLSSRPESNESFGFMDDGAELFSEEEEAELLNLARSRGWQIGAVLGVVTVSYDTEMKGTSFAREYLLEHGYGYGDGAEGIVFLIDMYQRQYTVYEYNRNASGYLLTDYEGDLILDALESHMRSADYAEAAREFFKDCLMYAYTSLGGNYESSQGLHEQEPSVNWLICGLIGLVAGALITGLMILLRNNDGKTDTTVYAPKGAFRIISQDDRYIRTTVTKRKIETSSGGSGGGGGGGGFSGGGSGGGHGGSRGF